MEDLIRRSDAIKALRLEYPMMPMFKSLREEWAIKTEGFRKAEEVIMRLPSADRPRGEWLKFGLGRGTRILFCTNCERRIEVPLSQGDSNYDFCPNCGAKMREREGE